MKKRHFLQTGAIFIASTALSSCLPVSSQSNAQAQLKRKFAVTKTEAEWRQALTPDQFHVLRQQGTERPFSSPLEHQAALGTFACAGCGQPLFSSEAKFNSGTGWPSFYTPLADAIGTSTDYALFIPRVEVHCSSCGGHLGHVFDDGPPPTGKRYCINGVALKFVPT